MVEFPPAASSRFETLDGIRGWASLTVVACHLTGIFAVPFPLFRGPYLAFLLNGGLAVSVFFVLSGAALSMKFLARQDLRQVDGLLVKRYFRLTIPVFYSCVIVYAIQLLHWNCNIAAADVIQQGDGLGTNLTFAPSAVRAILFATVDVYYLFDPRPSYNPFLWTMSYELKGSLLTFALLYCYPFMQYRTLTLFLAAFVAQTVSPNLACFVCGIWLAQCLRMEAFDAPRSSGIWSVASVAVLLALMYYDMSTWHEIPMIGGKRVVVVAATLVVLTIVSSSSLNRFMSSPLSVFLGRISFPLFILQFPVMISFTSGLILYVHAQHALTLTDALWIIGASLALCLAVAWGSLWVERLTMRACALTERAAAGYVTGARVALMRRAGLEPSLAPAEAA